MRDRGSQDTLNERALGSPVRVLIVAPAPLTEPWAGGISSFIRSFVCHMPSDFEVSICGVEISDKAPPARWQSLDVAGRKVRFLPVTYILPGGRAGRMPVKARAFMGLVSRRRLIPTDGQIIQVHSPAMDLAFLGRRGAVIRVVHNAPENLATPRTGTQWRHFAWALRRAERMTYRRAGAVFFVDRPTFLQYSSEHDSALRRMHYLPNGVNTDVFRVRAGDERTSLREQLAAELSVPRDAPWLLFAGRLDRQKDPQLLLQTFAAVKAGHADEQGARMKDAQLLIAGDGPLRAEAERAAANLGIADSTHFVGRVAQERLAALMSGSDAFLLSSVYEGAPFVVLESLASGLPVVSTSVGDIPRLVIDRATGWLAKGHSPEELARGVAWALFQPRDEIAVRCAASMADYRIENVLAPFYDEHRRLANEFAS